MKKIKKMILMIIKKMSIQQMNDVQNGKCLFLCFQPKIPEKLKKSQI